MHLEFAKAEKQTSTPIEGILLFMRLKCIYLGSPELHTGIRRVSDPAITMNDHTTIITSKPSAISPTVIRGQRLTKYPN